MAAGIGKRQIPFAKAGKGKTDDRTVTMEFPNFLTFFDSMLLFSQEEK